MTTINELSDGVNKGGLKKVTKNITFLSPIFYLLLISYFTLSLSFNDSTTSSIIPYSLASVEDI